MDGPLELERVRLVLAGLFRAVGLDGLVDDLLQVGLLVGPGDGACEQNSDNSEGKQSSHKRLAGWNVESDRPDTASGRWSDSHSFKKVAHLVV